MKLKIGDLATRVGLSVRTLHHYHAIGLLCPALRLPGGARLYGEADFQRLHRIQVLKGMGYGLGDIRRLLDDPTVDARALVEQQALQLEAQARRAQALSATLRQVSRRLGAGADVGPTDWLDLLEMTALYAQHLTDDELQRLHAPRHQGRRQAGRDVEAERSRLVAAVAACLQQGLAPDTGRARTLAWRWVRMVIELTRNDAAIAAKLRALQLHSPRAQALVGIDAAMLDWIDQAIVHARVHLFGKYLSPPQTAELRRRQLAHRNAWPELVAQVRAQMEAGALCTAGPVQALAAQWRQLFRASYGGDDAALLQGVRQALAEEPRLSLGVGVDEALMRYVRAADAVAAGTGPATAAA